MQIFISYARSDGTEPAHWLVDRLRSAGHEPWIDDERLAAGAIWSEEIERRLDESDVVLAVLTRAFAASRMCRAETTRAWRQNKVLIPVLVHHDADKNLFVETIQHVDFSSPGLYEPSFARLLQDIGAGHGTALRERYRSTYVTAPTVTGPLVMRSAESKRLREVLLSDDTGRAPVAIVGMGGKGKTTLAKVLCADPVVQSAFVDGIVWLGIGTAAGDLLPQMREVGKVFAQPPERFDNAVAAANQLRTALQDKSVLMVLDDVWHPQDVQPFLELSAGCRVVFTARDKRIAAAVGAADIEPSPFAAAEALQLLSARSGVMLSALPKEAAGIVEFCQGLPLALAMIGAMLRGQPSRWKTALKRLQDAHLRWVEQVIGGYEYGSIMASIEVSVRQLPPLVQQRYGGLAIFRKDEPIPAAALQRLWGVDPDEAEDTAVLVDTLSLGTFDAGRLTLHHLQSDYLVDAAGAARLLEMHRAFLAKYDPGGRQWTLGPRDGYFFEHLAYHLDRAGLSAELDALLFDYDWLAARLGDADPHDVAADFDFGTPADAKRKVKHALMLSAAALAADPRQLAGHLIGRLLDDDDPAIRALLGKATRAAAPPWLEPRIRSLTGPLGALLQRRQAHHDGVRAAIVSPDGRHLITGGRHDGGQIRVWDLDGYSLIKVLVGHADGVAVLAMDARTGLLASGSWDKTIRIWNLQSGECVHVLTGHDGPALAMAFVPGTGELISSGPDGTIRVWNVQTGKEVRRLRNFSQSVFDLTLTPDERHILCVGYDESVKIIDFQSGELVNRLLGHKAGASGGSIAVSSDGSIAISASFDRTLRVWDLATGAHLGTLTGHHGGINDVCILPGRRLALSGSDDGTVRLWDLQTGTATATFHTHEGSVRAVAFSPSADRAFSASDDGSIAAWDLSNRSELRPQIMIPGGISSADMSVDGRTVLIGTFWSEVYLWRTEGSQPTPVGPDHAAGRPTVAVAPDGQLGVSWADDGQLRVWDLEQSSLAVSLPLAEKASFDGRVAISGDKRRVVAANAKMLTTWDLETGQELNTTRGEDVTLTLASVAMSHDGRSVFVPAEKALNVWDATTHQVTRVLTGLDRCHEFAISERNRLIAACGYVETRRYDLAGTEPTKVLFSRDDYSETVDITSDGSLAVSAGGDRQVRVWDLNAASLLAAFETEGRLNSCAISDDGTIVFATEPSGVVHLLTLRRT